MKLRIVIMACVISTAVLLGGCGSVSQPSRISSNGEKIFNIAIDTTTEAPTEAAGMDYYTPDTGETGEGDDSLTPIISGNTDTVSAALDAYRTILATNPAIEGDPEILYDASFSYEDNYAMFGNHYDHFAIMDINQDEMPELIALTVVNFRWTPISIFTYKDGDTVLLKSPQEEWVEGTFDQCSTANGAYTLYICPSHHIHNVWSGADPMGELLEDNYAYEMNGTTLTLVDCCEGSEVFFYDISHANVPENLNF